MSRPRGSYQNTFCIQYWPMKEPSKIGVLERFDEENNPVSTEMWDDVQFFDSLQDAMPTCKKMLSEGWDVKVRKCCEGRDGYFWLM